jgi:hypothetical protein
MTALRYSYLFHFPLFVNARYYGAIEIYYCCQKKILIIKYNNMKIKFPIIIISTYALKNMLNFKKCLPQIFLIAVFILANSFPIVASAKTCKPHHAYWDCVGNCPGELDDWWCYDDDLCGPCFVAGSSVGDEWDNCDAGAGAHYCNHNCLKTNSNNFPKNPRWYDDPTKNNDAAANRGNVNDTLPIVLDWEVNSWKSSSHVKWAIPNYATNSAYIEIDNPDNQLFEPEKVPGATYDATRKVLGKCLTNDYFNSRDDGLPCLFRAGKQNITYRVKVCCASDCTNCGDFVQWNFSTGEFAEPKSPLDPDWNGPNGATGVSSKKLQVEWCSAWITKTSPNDWAKSYKLMTTSDETTVGQQSCHPLLVSNKQCVDTSIVADTSSNDVTTLYPIESRKDLNLFARDRTYVWKMKTCFDTSSAQCENYGQSWKFSTKNEPIGLPQAISPQNDLQGTTTVSLPISMSWTIPDGSNSFVFESNFISGSQNITGNSIPAADSAASLKNKFDAPNLAANTAYKWRVKACSQFNYLDCDDWSAWFNFRTTGRPPKQESLKQTAAIPTTFSWDAVPGAKSYNFSLVNSSNITATSTISDAASLINPKYTLGYPTIDQAESYNWKVQACAHADGSVCGAWSNLTPFSTPELTTITTTATSTDPCNNCTIYSQPTARNISWYVVPGASAYHYVLTLITPTEANCIQNPIEKTVLAPLDLVELNCLGTYQLTVHPCVDTACRSMGPQSQWQFVLAQQIPANRPALAVCGLNYDLPDTPWNEREPCQPKHMFLLSKVAIDFALFKLTLYLLPLLALITGLIFYSSFKTSEVWEKVRGAWKAIGIGLAILFLAWVIVGIILQIVGFTGLWWKII